jgi:hypothetical protein
VELRVDQVDLTQVGLRGVRRDPRAVLDGDAEMRVSLDAEAFEEADAGHGRLAEGVLAVTADGGHHCRCCCAHVVSLLRS